MFSSLRPSLNPVNHISTQAFIHSSTYLAILDFFHPFIHVYPLFMSSRRFAFPSTVKPNSYLFIIPCNRQPIYRFICLPIYLSGCLPVICPSAYSSTYLLVHLSACLSIHRAIYQPIYLRGCQFIQPSISPSVCLSVPQSVQLYIFLF